MLRRICQEDMKVFSKWKIRQYINLTLSCFNDKVYEWVTSWENLFLQYANNKGATQPAHPCSLTSTFVVCCLDSIIPLVFISEISSLHLASVAVQAGLRFLVANPEDRFSRDGGQIVLCNYFSLIVFDFSLQIIWYHHIFSWIHLSSKNKFRLLDEEILIAFLGLCLR